MRVAFILLFFAANLVSLRADRPNIESISPDKTWVITARWIKSGTSAEGYDWSLRNAKTGKIYFHEAVQKDEFLPVRFDVVWNPNSHYAALNLYYGRLLYDVDVISLLDTPESLDIPLTVHGTSAEKTFLHTEDISSFQGYQPPLRTADKWINDTDLKVGLSFAAYLTDKKSGKKYVLHTEWQQTIRFKKKSSELIENTCDSYDKDPH